MVHFLCEMLTDTMDLSHVTLSVNLRYTNRLAWDNLDRPHSILGALAFLRNAKSARVSGIDDSRATHFEALMMKQEKHRKYLGNEDSISRLVEYWVKDP